MEIRKGAVVIVYGCTADLPSANTLQHAQHPALPAQASLLSEALGHIQLIVACIAMAHVSMDTSGPYRRPYSPGCLPILRCTGIPFYPKSLDEWHERVHVCDLYSMIRRHSLVRLLISTNLYQSGFLASRPPAISPDSIPSLIESSEDGLQQEGLRQEVDDVEVDVA